VLRVADHLTTEPPLLRAIVHNDRSDRTCAIPTAES
jgi:hypothetical protein